MTDIEQLLRTYSQPYVKGEKRSRQYNNTINREYRHKQRIITLYQLNNELPNELQLNNHEKEVVATILEIFKNDIQFLHRQAKKEAIILAIIFTVKKRVRPRLQITDPLFYPIAEKYGLSNPILITILSRLTNYYMFHNPQLIRETTKYDQTILYKSNPETRE